MPPGALPPPDTEIALPLRRWTCTTLRLSPAEWRIVRRTVTAEDVPLQSLLRDAVADAVRARGLAWPAEKT